MGRRDEGILRNGQLKSETNFKNDKPEGVWKSYYENGQLREEKYYKDGKPDGAPKIYDENGQLVTEECFM